MASEQDKVVGGSRPTGDEHAAFVARLEAIAAGLGSRAELAKQAGIAPSSLQNYVDGSEPTRPVLIHLARAGRVSLGWLVGGRGPKRADNLPEGFFELPYYDLRPNGDRIHPLLVGQPSESRIFSRADFDQNLLDSASLQAMRTNQGFPPEIGDGDLFVVDTAVQVGLAVGGQFPRPHSAIDPKAIYATAYQARLRLRRLRWAELGKTMAVLAPGSKKVELTVTEKTYDFQVIGRVAWRGGWPTP